MYFTADRIYYRLTVLLYHYSSRYPPQRRAQGAAGPALQAVHEAHGQAVPQLHQVLCLFAEFIHIICMLLLCYEQKECVQKEALSESC